MNKTRTTVLWDIIFGGVILIFSIYVFVSGLSMILADNTGTDVWYYSPGIYPAFVGACLFILSVILICKKLPLLKTVSPTVEETPKVPFFSWNNPVIRIVAAIALLAIYVFVLIGHVHFAISTFIYLFATMFVFRPKSFKIWKIAVIALATSAFVFLFFTYAAKVPLP